jgi:tetratricopeptide (TPR) repeat protein
VSGTTANPVVTPARAARLPLLLVVAALAALLLAAYANSFRVPFLFDDTQAIPQNPTLQSWREALSPPGNGVTVSGRPLLNLSFALNRSLSSNDVWSYHVANLGIHFLAALTLFGLARRTFRTAALNDRFGAAADGLALLLAALWAVHPLQTESVTYVVQRAESLAGLFYLLTVYCFVRGAQAPVGPWRWYATSAALCLLGIATKETLVTAPVVLLLYDRVFLAGSFRAAWRARRGAYALLLVSWLPLAILVLGTGGNRGGTFAFTPSGFTGYWLSQFEAICRYVQLTFWPHPLVLDYAFVKVSRLSEVAGYAAVVVTLLGMGAWAWFRRPAAGFLAAVFFILLAPASLMPGTIQTIVEHRMYLPLATVLALAVAAVHRLAGRRGLFVLGLAVPVFGVATFQRNADYQSALSMWRDTVVKAPGNARAHNNLGNLLDDAGQIEEARREYEAALALQPDYASAHTNLAGLLIRQGRGEEIVARDREAVRAGPQSAVAHAQLGNTLALLGRWADAQAEFEAVLRLAPEDAMAHNNLGNVLFNLGRADAAAAQFERALPQLDNPTLRFNLGTALATTGRTSDALAHFEIAAKQDPHRAEIPYSMGVLLFNEGRRDEAIPRLREALRLDPNYAEARQLLTELGQAVP